MWGQFADAAFGSVGLDENASYQKMIESADRMIDEYCRVPEDFFVAGGVEVQQEYLDGKDVAYIGGVTKFFNWYYGGTSHLKFKHKPVLSVTKLEEETTTGTWTTRSEGSGSDYIVVDDGVRYITNTPSWKYKNVRATYKAGYTSTPTQVSVVSARLAAALLHRVKDANNRKTTSIGTLSVTAPVSDLSQPVFSDDLKRLLVNYKRVVYAFV